MSTERRLEYLLNAALRAEQIGDFRIARLLRRMAEELQPIDRGATLALTDQPSS